MSDAMNAAMQMQQQNRLQRAAVLENAVEMVQPLAPIAVNPSQQSVVNIIPRNVGLLKGFLVEVSGTIANTAAAQLTRSIFGASNIVKNFTFTDLNNNVRINAPGYLLATLNSARQGWGFGGVYANNLAFGYGNNFDVNSAPATVAVSTDAAIKQIYYVPLAYSGDDLRGAIYAAVVSANMNLQITLNTTPCVGATDELDAIYKGNAAAGWKANTNITVAVTQIYLDQLPIIGGSPVVPMLDLNTIYEIKQTTLNGITAGQDFPIPYANFRDFLSTFVVYDNAGVYNAGTDVNYFSLTSANFTNLFKYGPSLAALFARQTFMTDVPLGCYYFSHRNKPLNTIAFGNMELNINASTATAGAKVIVGTEAFAQQNQLMGGAASSLAAG